MRDRIPNKPSITLFDFHESDFGLRHMKEGLESMERSLLSIDSKWVHFDENVLQKIYTYYATLDPFVGGWNGRNIATKADAYKSDWIMWGGTRYLSVFESWELLYNRTLQLQKKQSDLEVQIVQGKALNVKDKFIYLLDVPRSYVNDNYLMVNDLVNGLIATSSVLPNNTFLGLKDTPHYYQATDGGSLIVTNSSMDGVHFDHKTFLHKRASYDCTASYFYAKYELDCVDIRINRMNSGGTFGIALDAGYDGADLYSYLVDDTSASYSPVFFYGNSCVVENEPLYLGDSTRFVHLIYNPSISQWEIASIDKGV